MDEVMPLLLKFFQSKEDLSKVPELKQVKTLDDVKEGMTLVTFTQRGSRIFYHYIQNIGSFSDKWCFEGLELVDIKRGDCYSGCYDQEKKALIPDGPYEFPVPEAPCPWRTRPQPYCPLSVLRLNSKDIKEHYILC